MKTKNIVFGGFYIFQGRACANSCLIEKLDNAKKFVMYMNYYFKGYLKVYDYCIGKDSWELAVKLHDKESILERMDSELEYPEDEVCWRIISERVRLFLSTFVRVTNRDRGRTGTLVHESYEKLYFERLGEAILYLNDIRQRRILYYAPGSKYEGVVSQYQIGRKESVYLSSKAGMRNGYLREKLSDVLSFRAITNLVLENVIFETKTAHKHLNFNKNNNLPLKI